jgi:hypothetical protein
MSDNHLSAHQEQRKIRPIWRWCIGVAATVGMALMVVNYQVARSINGYYFHDPSVPIKALDIFVSLLASYLLLVAIFGRWRLFPHSR